ncbi:MAG: CaiB/BaiF CoA transferase family protein [Niabella sp.]
MVNLPLKGLLVLEFSQYLSGPSAGLRLADLGARVIKIERPDGGDPCRSMALKNLWVNDDSILFHTINRNKESFTADLKSAGDLQLVKKLIAQADVMTHNFRPGVMEKIGLAYSNVQHINPKIIYAEITGYGKKGPWKDKPGQDLLLQSLSGLAYTTGNKQDAPMPFGLSVVDSICGNHAVQGILAALIRRQKTGTGAHIELSLLESALNFQFELLTTYYNSNKPIERSRVNNGNPLLGAPYGIYKTADSHIAMAMMNLNHLQQALDCDRLRSFTEKDTFKKRDEMKAIIADKLLQHTTAYWLKKLQQYNLWVSEVLDWNEMTKKEGYQVLQMEQDLHLPNQSALKTTRCPIVINGEKLYSSKPAPVLGEQNEIIKKEMLGL